MPHPDRTPSNSVISLSNTPGAAILRYLPLTLLAALAATLLWAGVLQHLKPEAALTQANALVDWAQQQPLVSAVLSAGLVAALTACGLPGAAAVFLVSGFLIGPYAAVLAAAIGNVIGTSALYLALRQAVFRQQESARAPGLIAAFRDRPFIHALLLRAIPIVPNGAATAILAALRCPWPSFLAASALGHLPNAALLAWLGAQAAADLQDGRPLDLDLLGDPRWWLPMLLLVAITVLSMLFRRRSQRLGENDPTIATAKPKLGRTPPKDINNQPDSTVPPAGPMPVPRRAGPDD